MTEQSGRQLEQLRPKGRDIANTTKFQLSGGEYHVTNGKAKTASYVAGRDIKITVKKNYRSDSVAAEDAEWDVSYDVGTATLRCLHCPR
jgi:hypothetical protein